jgi:RimJ/RimL family protein N-acetyltransferase
VQTPADGTENEPGQPVGRLVPGWTVRPALPETPMPGRYCRLERLDPAGHGQELFEANVVDVEGRNWTYLPYGPFGRFGDYRAWLDQVAGGQDPQFWAVLTEAGQAVGVGSYLRIDRTQGVIEVGHLNFSPVLQRTPAATEVMNLMMRRVFEELGYRRYEWKCDALNAPSRAAAARLGFRYEGTFRQAAIVKGRSRDTAWFSITDAEWPALSRAFGGWLQPANFDADGRQRRALADLRTDADLGGDA